MIAAELMFILMSKFLILVRIRWIWWWWSTFQVTLPEKIHFTLCYFSFIVDSKRYFNINHYSEVTILLKCSSILPDKMLCLLFCCYTNYDWFEWVICESPLAYVVHMIFVLLDERHLPHESYQVNNICTWHWRLVIFWIILYIYQAYQQHYVNIKQKHV